ncbi:MAG: type II secretion system protein GspD [Candidatus Cryptobacteroides sp.]
MRRILFVCIVFFVSALSPASADDARSKRLRSDLDELALRDTVYRQKVDVSVTNFSIVELVKGLAIANGLSIDVNFDRKKTVTCNLVGQPVKDVLYFICTEKNIDALIVGNIVTLVDYVPPVPAPVIDVVCDSSAVSFDFSSCRLDTLSRRFTSATGVNLVVPNTLADREVSAFGRGMSVDDAVQSIAMVNGLYARQENGRDWILSKENRKPQTDRLKPTGPVVTVYPMKYRTVDNVVELIPAELKREMEIKTFHDQNSLVISGDGTKCDGITDFLDEVDKSVPLISIDVMIVDATTNSAQTLGLGLGVGSEKKTSKGTLSPGLDVTLNAESINRILASFSGLGSINLGPVTSLFYADLQLLEEAGKIVLRSTPRLSTLNGHKATLKSGEVKYYKESQVNIIGTQNPLQSESFMWKNVEANFVLEITPHVSRDSTITMDINLSQDEFTTSDDDKYTPPGISKRSFTSIIKVKDGEMVLLGGIEKNLRDNNSKGLPYVSRAPVLRSIFGKTKKLRTDSRLNIFIKPTIVQ